MGWHRTTYVISEEIGASVAITASCTDSGGGGGGGGSDDDMDVSVFVWGCSLGRLEPRRGWCCCRFAVLFFPLPGTLHFKALQRSGSAFLMCAGLIPSAGALKHIHQGHQLRDTYTSHTFTFLPFPRFTPPSPPTEKKTKTMKDGITAFEALESGVLHPLRELLVWLEGAAAGAGARLPRLAAGAKVAVELERDAVGALALAPPSSSRSSSSGGLEAEATGKGTEEGTAGSVAVVEVSGSVQFTATGSRVFCRVDVVLSTCCRRRRCCGLVWFRA